MSNLSVKRFEEETGLEARYSNYEYQVWLQNRVESQLEDEIAKNQAHESIAKVMDMEHKDNIIG